MSVKDGEKDSTKMVVFNSLLMTVNDLKRKIEEDYKIPMNNQKLLINNLQIQNGEKLLGDFYINDKAIDVSVSKERNIFVNHTTHHDSESDDETQNEKVGVKAGEELKAPSKLKIEEDGWECPLCTLINMPNRPGCLACSTTRPVSYKVPSRYQEIEYKLKVNEDLRTFFEMEKVEARQPSQVKNDLNRQSANRKTSDISSILVEEKN